MNEFKKQLMAKIGDTTEQKNRVIKRVNDALDSKPRKKFAWGYYVTFATFVGIFVVGLMVLPKLLNEQASLTEENPTVIDPITEPTKENGYYEELKQFFPPDVNEQSIFGVYEADQYDFKDIDSEWELSPDGTKRATLVGRAKDFEGINVLVIEDLATKKFTIYKLKDESIQNTPKDLEWIDTNRLYVIVGYGFGTVTRGGSLYELELENHFTTPIIEYDASTSKEEIMSITSNGDGTFTYEKHIYQDDELNYGYVEENIISPTK